MNMMTNQKQLINMKKLSPDQQGTGAFDGGRITEVKPIGFPHEPSGARRIGPLFYWAWATAKGYGKIGLHPHKGFEIMSYVLEGEIGHRDTLGTLSRVKTGGAQVMQTGSGVSHEEETLGDHTEFFQIWFEPDLQEAVRRSPTYREFHHGDFPVGTKDGVTTKSIIGDGGPVSLVAPVTMQEISVSEGNQLVRTLTKGNSLAALVIAGEGSWYAKEANQRLSVSTGDLAVIEATIDSELVLQTEGTNPLRTAIVEVPVTVPYRLYA
jgi:redox-sensitive bicupin YhaK (pirin superfamily)